MDVQWWIDDDELLEVLDEAMRTTREMPAAFVAAGKAAYAWRTIDAELAALTFDSKWEELALTRTESAELRTLTFATDGLTIELELTPHEVLGQLSPPQAGTVRLASDGDAVGTLPIDDLGFFIVRPVPRHPFRVVCETASGVTVLTGWISP
ncbi:hypothetical protein AB0P21_25150 [Kribbella sp. NPDC056861]|uniref:hypothetical protein n=1 Tax=Kribbella sp. NPDC056861 TaxID=3154857 RepID=UPI003431ABD9